MRRRWKTTVRCKSCNAPVQKFFSFGKLPLGNVFPKTPDPQDEELYELDLGYCNSCSLVQQTRPPPTEALVRDYRNYRYVPTGNTLKVHYAAFGQKIATDLNFSPNSFIIDIGCNDGSLLASVAAASRAKTLGVEPAVDVSEIAKDKGIPVINEFFNYRLAQKIAEAYGRADVVCCTQTLQHIPDLADFINGIALLLKPEGVFVYEGRYLADMIEKRSYDTCYHEMLYFFSLHSLFYLLKSHNFTYFGAEETDVYGGSLRMYASRVRSLPRRDFYPVIDKELDAGLTHVSTYRNWGTHVEQMREELVRTISKLKDQHRTIAGYGAPSTSATLLNYCHLTANEIRFIVDDNPMKQGLYAPGSHIPIVGPEKLREVPVDYVILLAWRLKAELVPKIKELQLGARILAPLPRVEVI